MTGIEKIVQDVLGAGPDAGQAVRLALLVGSIVVGLLWCLMGYRIFRASLALLGFLLGAAGLGWLGYETGGRGWGIAGAIVGGLAGAVAMFLLYLLGVFVMGAFLAALAAAAGLAAAGVAVHPALLLIPAAVGGVIAVLLSRFLIVALTAFNGAWCVVGGVAGLTGGQPDLTSVLQSNRLPETLAGEYGLILGAWLLLGAVGVIVQYRRIRAAEAGKERTNND